MGGRRRLRGGFSVWLPDHRASAGKDYRRALKAGLELLGLAVPPSAPRSQRKITSWLNGSELLRLEVERYAKASVLHQEATRHWADMLNRRQAGKGRRPTERRIERAARRVGLADMTLKECTARLEALAIAKPRDLASVVTAVHQARGR
jgi:hypothetical protein